MGTKFTSVYNCFLNKITDDMYMELTPQDTKQDLQNLLISAIPGFEFPRILLDYTLSEDEDFDYEQDTSAFDYDLSNEEIDILATLMLQGWVQRQVTSVENIRMKYSGTDFKFTSQQAHLNRLMTLLANVKTEVLHKQRLYKRRRINEKTGLIESNWSVFRESSVVK